MSIEARVARLEEQVADLQNGRPGRKRLPILVSKLGVCGVDPERESTDCPDASLYRRRQGCKGNACMRASSEYYAAYHGRVAASEEG